MTLGGFKFEGDPSTWYTEEWVNENATAIDTYKYSLYLSYKNENLLVDHQGNITDSNIVCMSEEDARKIFTFNEENGTESLGDLKLKKISVSSYIANDTNVVIPIYIYDSNGILKYQITKVGTKAFAKSTDGISLETVKIYFVTDSSAYTPIATDAFENQTNITDIYFPLYHSTDMNSINGYDTAWGATNATVHIGSN